MDEAEFDAVVKVITEKTAASNAVYAKFHDKLNEGSYENYYIGTVEAAPSLEDVVNTLKTKGTYTRVVLEPLMVVAGDHANNDMAGEEEDSWKTVLANEGYEVECILEGLGQIPAIQEIYVAHLQEAIAADTAFVGVEETTQDIQVAEELEDGTYAIEAESSSSMFQIEKAQLTVADGEMTAVITLGGTGYSKLYMGTSEQAKEAADADCIPFAEDGDGAYTYIITVGISVRCSIRSRCGRRKNCGNR